MIPVNNKNIAPCSPVSSNCVIWQGPDIPCIGICNGDTVSDVVGKLGDELCDLINGTCQCNPDLTGLDLNCLPVNTPLNLEAVLQAIIDYVCALSPGGSGPLPNIQLPTCLRYNDPLGNPVTQLPLDQFAVLLGNKICVILSDITNLNVALTALQSRVTILENCVLPCVPSGPTGGDFDVMSDCLFPGTLVPISQLVLALEDSFCLFRSAVGSVTQINAAVSAQCLFGSTPRLSGTGNYGGIQGWVSTPTTLAESNINQWLVLCDLYAAVKDIKDNCCVTGCAGVVFDVQYSTIDQNTDGVVEAIKFIFTGSTIPAGFSDCGGFTTMTITDSNGSSITQVINVASLASSPAGVTVALTGLNTLASVNVQIPFCMSDGTSQCSDKQTLIIPLNIPCPTVTATAVLSDINVSFPNSLGTGVTYSIVAIDTLTGANLGSTVITNPGTNVAHTFGGAIGGRTYNIIVTVSQGSSVKTCPPTSVTVSGVMGYVFDLCNAGNVNVQWMVAGITPVIGNFYKWTDPTTGIQYCGSVVSGPQVISTIDYTTGTSDGTTITNCLDCITPAPVTYNCVSGNCVDPGNGTGTYSTLAACQAVCAVPATRYNCVSGNCVANVTGTYASLAACQAVCVPPVPQTYNCVLGTCVDPLDGTGTYSTLLDCQDNCIAPAPVSYNCVSGNCIDPLDGSGTYTSLASCQAVCTPPPVTTYNCVSGNCVSVSGSGGTYSTLSACQAACASPKPEVLNVTGYMEPCIGGTIDDHMGAAVYLDQPVSIDTRFDVLIGYTDPSGSCSGSLTLQNLQIEILAGNSSSNFTACTSGAYIPGGALICTACIQSCDNPDVNFNNVAC